VTEDAFAAVQLVEISDPAVNIAARTHYMLEPDTTRLD